MIDYKDFRAPSPIDDTPEKSELAETLSTIVWVLLYAVSHMTLGAATVVLLLWAGFFETVAMCFR